MRDASLPQKVALLSALQTLEAEAWQKEVSEQEEFFGDLQDRVPQEMVLERALLMCRL